MIRGALHGLGCFHRGLPDSNADGGQFLRELAALEPDATMQERLLKAAAHFEASGFTGSHDFDKIMAGEE